MVKPTVTTDAIVSTNRFAVLGITASNSQNPESLLDANGASSTAASLSNNSKGALPKNKIVNVNGEQRYIPGLHIGRGKNGKNIRDRSNSIISGEQGTAAKTPRVETSECPHLKTINENKVSISRVLDSMADYQGDDSTIAANIRSLALCMNSLNDILGTVMAERLVPGNIPDGMDCDDEPEVIVNSKPTFSFPPSNSSRQPLKQQPLGNTETWATAVGKNKKKAPQDQRNKPVLQQEDRVTDEKEDTQDSKFTKAVKEAERSILVFNLNLEQSPIMNPTTISAKVTVSLLNILADKEGLPPGNHSTNARELVDDIVSQVVRMEFFGSKTVPCKFPNNSLLNGSFYTIPVKMVFKDRRTAQTAADLLRKHLNLHSTTPYHKSLRAAITQAINRAKESNPGHHAKVNLDMNGKTLKCFIRTDTNPPGSWVPLGKNIPIPEAALDPGARDLSKVVLPTSPNCPSIRSLQRKSGTDNNSSNQSSTYEIVPFVHPQDTGFGTWAADEPDTPSEVMKLQAEVNASVSPLPAFMNTPKTKGNGSHPISGRSNLILCTPPGSDKDRRSSFGS
jgi:hypothetical protein